MTLHGHLPPAPPGSDVQPRGFYVTRVVEATTAAEAGAAAIQLLHAEPKFTRMAGSYGQAPDLRADQVELATGIDALAVNRSGYLFYEEDQREFAYEPGGAGRIDQEGLMVSSYVRIRCPPEGAIARYGRWPSSSWQPFEDRIAVMGWVEDDEDKLIRPAEPPPPWAAAPTLTLGAPMTSMRTTAYWAGVALLVAISALGLWSALGSLDSVGTTGQQAATATQLGYALAGFVAAWALVIRRSWASTPLWLWAALITLTGGLAPVVWGGAGPGTGLVAAAASAATAGLVAWLVTRR